MTSSPTFRPARACTAKLSTSSHASGAPSEPWRGAWLRVLMLEWIRPIRRNTPTSPFPWVGAGLLSVIVPTHPSLLKFPALGCVLTLYRRSRIQRFRGGRAANYSNLTSKLKQSGHNLAGFAAIDLGEQSCIFGTLRAYVNPARTLRNARDETRRGFNLSRRANGDEDCG